MTSPLSALRSVQESLRAIVEPLPEAELRKQFHPDLSPLGWHLGHCVFVEAFWIYEQWLDKPSPVEGLHDLYFPEQSPKPKRGRRLPDKAELLAWARERQRLHVELLTDHPATARRHPLMRADYLPRFLLQHHAQHVEIMHMALAQRESGAADAPAAAVTPRPPRHERVTLPAGEYRLGHGDTAYYDNERPPRDVRLAPTAIARYPVRNAEFLAFMRDGGYRNRRWWTEEGWNWRTRTGAAHPEHWRHDGNGGWRAVTPAGIRPLRAESTLMGINYFEARAYAAWAGARLPHEYEWEAAESLGLLADVGMSWEWCHNRFHPYPGFRPFPYDGYSLPWFDGDHYVLRGGSPYTLSWIRRPSFRNFYTPDKRHIFAGCRLAYD